MRTRLYRSLALTALLLTLSPLHCRAIDPSPNQISAESLNQSLSDQDLQQWYHLSAGTQLIPYDWLVALPGIEVQRPRLREPVGDAELLFPHHDGLRDPAP